ncbi:MAG: hypothetical protein ACI910_000294 [Oleispira sp.]|jgi:hypothetical protein
MLTVDIEDNELLADEITTLAGQINAANYRFLKLAVMPLRKNMTKIKESNARSRIFKMMMSCGIFRLSYPQKKVVYLLRYLKS